VAAASSPGSRRPSSAASTFFAPVRTRCCSA